MNSLGKFLGGAILKVITPFQDITAFSDNHNSVGFSIYKELYDSDILYDDFYNSMFSDKGAIWIEMFKKVACIHFPNGIFLTSYQYNALCEMRDYIINNCIEIFSNLFDENLDFDELLIILKDYVNDDLIFDEEFGFYEKNIKK